MANFDVLNASKIYKHVESLRCSGTAQLQCFPDNSLADGVVSGTTLRLRKAWTDLTIVNRYQDKYNYNVSR